MKSMVLFLSIVSTTSLLAAENPTANQEKMYNQVVISVLNVASRTYELMDGMAIFNEKSCGSLARTFIEKDISEKLRPVTTWKCVSSTSGESVDAPETLTATASDASPFQEAFTAYYLVIWIENAETLYQSPKGPYRFASKSDCEGFGRELVWSITDEAPDPIKPKIKSTCQSYTVTVNG